MTKQLQHTAVTIKPREFMIRSLDHGGFVVGAIGDDYGLRHGGMIAAFTTRDEAVEWMRANIATPTKAEKK